MSVITISREFGSGGDLLAQSVARTLGYHPGDKAFVGAVLCEHGVAEFDVEYEKQPGFRESFDVEWAGAARHHGAHAQQGYPCCGAPRQCRYPWAQRLRHPGRPCGRVARAPACAGRRPDRDGPHRAESLVGDAAAQVKEKTGFALPSSNRSITCRGMPCTASMSLSTPRAFRSRWRSGDRGSRIARPEPRRQADDQAVGNRRGDGAGGGRG